MYSRCRIALLCVFTAVFLSGCTSELTYEEAFPAETTVASFQTLPPNILAAHTYFQALEKQYNEDNRPVGPVATFTHVSQLTPLWQQARIELFFGSDSVVVVPFAVAGDTLTSADYNAYLTFSTAPDGSPGVSVLGLYGSETMDWALGGHEPGAFSGYVYTMDEHLVANRVIEFTDGRAQRAVFDPSGLKFLGEINQHLKQQGHAVTLKCSDGPGTGILAWVRRLFGSRVSCPSPAGGSTGGGGGFFESLFSGFGSALASIFSGGGGAPGGEYSGLSSSDFWYVYGSIPTNTGGYTLVPPDGGGSGGVLDENGGLPGGMTDPKVIYGNLSSNPAAVELSKLILGYTIDKTNAENLLSILNIFVDQCMQRSDINLGRFARLYACASGELLSFLESNPTFRSETTLKEVLLARSVQVMTGSSLATFEYLQHRPALTVDLWDFVINQHNSSTEAVGYVRTVVAQMMADSGYKWQRFEELFNLVQMDERALLKDCAPDYAQWSDLINFKVGGFPLQRILEEDRWELQTIEGARSPTINLDRFSIHIDQLPVVNGKRLNAAEFFEYFRLNINDFAPEFTPTTYNGDNVNDHALWNSSNPYGSILEIALLGEDGLSFLADGDVICSQYNCCSWMFSTLRSGTEVFDSGWHPVSGHRQFGYKVKNGKFELYTRGADRVTVWWTNLLAEDKVFSDGSEFWRSMQRRIIRFVSDNNGAVNNIGVSESVNRPDWSKIKDLLKRSTPINYIPCDN